MSKNIMSDSEKISKSEEGVSSDAVQKNHPETFVGIDVSKGWIDVRLLPSQQTAHVETDEKSLGAWAKTLPGNITLVVMEATGGLEIPVFAALAARQIPVAVVNPFQTRNFAKSLNLRKKTDEVDAYVLALFAERMRPKARPFPTEQQRELDEILARRGQLTGMIASERNRKKQARNAQVLAGIEAHIAWMEGEVDDCDKKISALIAANPEWDALDKLLQTMPGVGAGSAHALICHLPELGALGRRALASLTGVAPFERQSGQWRGKSFCTGGRAVLRSMLFMAANSASRHNPPIREFYERLRARGKAHKVAIIACVRKMLTMLNTMVKNNEKWSSVQKTA
jgi:transposase